MSATSEHGLIDGTPSFTAAVFDDLRTRIRAEQLETWFRDFELTRVAEDEVEFSVPNGFVREWIQRNFLSHLEASVIAAGGRERRVSVRLAAPGHDHSPSREHAVPLAPAEVGGGHIGPDLEHAVETVERAREAAADPPRVPATVPRAPLIASSALNPTYTFEQFVIGSCNRLAHAAALAIGTNPGRAYNPFFVHGSVGLGKSHLLQAICHAVLRRKPDTNLVYLSCEEFTNRFIRSIQNDSVDDFRNTIRSVDMLVVDDVEFLANKDRTQEEFFHTFNALYNGQKQIVLSSDRPPLEIPMLQERLVSRFKWGLEADMQPPCFETRVAIIKRKALSRSVDIPDQVAHYVAERMDTNIRELEGAVIKVVGIATITDREVDMALAEEALQGFGAARTNQVSMQDIMNLITGEFSISVKDLTGKGRTQAVCLPRQIGMFLARQHTEHSLEEIGRRFGNRDHTTVLYAVGKIGKRAQQDRMFQELLAGLSNRLHTSARA